MDVQTAAQRYKPLGCPCMAVVKCAPSRQSHDHFQTLRQVLRQHIVQMNYDWGCLLPPAHPWRALWPRRKLRSAAAERAARSAKALVSVRDGESTSQTTMFSKPHRTEPQASPKSGSIIANYEKRWACVHHPR